MSLAARYFDAESKQIRENFLTLFPLRSCTVENLANTTLSVLKMKVVDCERISSRSRVQRSRCHKWQVSRSKCLYLKRTHSTIYVHCASHTLNLAISQACDIAQI